MNNNKIDSILSNYDAFQPSIIKNLRSILDHGKLAGSGKMFILAVDQGFEHGPDQSFLSNIDAYDPIYHFELACQSGLSAFAAPYGLLAVGARKFAGQIPLILKINHSNSLNKTQITQAIVSSVEKALELGCVGVGYTIYPGSDNFNDMIETLNLLSEESSKYGLLSVVWSYARGLELKNGLDTAFDVISYSAHMACLAGAHIVKVKIPTNLLMNESLKDKFNKILDINKMSERINHIKRSCMNGKRLVIFSGGASKENVLSLYDEINAVIQGDGDGSIIGRNIFQKNKQDALIMIEKIQNLYLSKNTTLFNKKDDIENILEL